MSKRIIISAAVCALLTVGAASASDDRICVRGVSVPAAAGESRVDVAALFERVRAHVEAGDDAPPALEVVIARIGPDGKPVLACVNSAADAKKFLEAPIEKVAGAKAQ